MIANRLAVTYLELGRTAEAEQLLARAVRIAENSESAAPLFYRRRSTNLSSIYVRQSRYGEAERC